MSATKEAEKRETYQLRARKENRRKILRRMWRAQPVSRSELSQQMGMNKSTMTYLIGDLMDEKLVVSAGNVQDGVGRAFNMLALNNDYGYAVGVMISTLSVEIAVSDLDANLLWKTEFAIPHDNASLSFLGTISTLIRQGLDALAIPPEKVLGMGISVPSVVEHETGFMYATPSINLYNLPIGEYFKSVFDRPVFVYSNSTNAARAEKWFGECGEHANVACLEISRGVGLGLILDGRVYTGSRGFAGADAAHMVLAPDGPLCACGKHGCWDTVGSILALGDQPLEDALARADEGDPAATQKFADIGHYIGLGIAYIVKIVNPERVVISGPILRAKQYIYASMTEALRSMLWPHVFSTTRVTFSELTESPPVLGALMSVIETVIG